MPVSDAAPQIAEHLSWVEVSLRLGLSVVFGAVVGWERKIADKPADVRTMALISAGAAAFTLMGVQLAAGVEPGQGLVTDPTRVLAYIISGIGFLGAGAILHSKKSIRGLTTAAAIWAAAAIGAACGLGLYVIATALFLIVFAMLWLPWTAHLVGMSTNGNGNGHAEGDSVDDEPALAPGNA